MIKFNKQSRIFTLSNSRFSYVFYVNEYDMPVKLYYGKAIHELDKNNIDAINDLGGDVYRYFDVKKQKEECLDEHLSSQYATLEVPPNLSFDKRESLISLTHEDNSAVTDFRYVSHEIIKGKPELQGLPIFVMKRKKPKP